jgi:hypothetical protein
VHEVVTALRRESEARALAKVPTTAPSLLTTSRNVSVLVSSLESLSFMAVSDRHYSLPAASLCVLS